MKKYLILILLTISTLFPTSIFAIGDTQQSANIEAKITKILEEKNIELMGSDQLYQKIELELSKPQIKKIIIENGNQPLANIVKYSVGDKVFVNLVSDPSEFDEFVIVDFVRTDSLILLSVIFILIILIIARLKGLFSMFGMVFTFFIVFFYLLPRILNGDNPIIISIVSSLFIIPVSFFLAHGFNKKTTIAIIGSIITLVATTILASIFIKLGHLTGLSSEEASMLLLDRKNLNMSGVLLSGIVVGALGVLDDITISQSAIVEELSLTAKLTKVNDLYSRAMIIGKDHITSMVNTLVLAYAGVSMPLLLIFVSNPHSLVEILNFEMVAEEIIRTLIGSIGLVLAVPITTYLAARSYKKYNL